MLLIAQSPLVLSSIVGIGGPRGDTIDERKLADNGHKSVYPLRMPQNRARAFAQRLTCTIDDACEVTGLGRTKLYELIGAGHIVTTTIGRRRLSGGLTSGAP